MASGRGLLASLAILATLIVAAPARAQGLSETDEAVLAGSCMACHGAGGLSPGSIPAIAGRPEKDLSEILLAFRAGRPSGATVMTRIMKGFDETEIAALARYYAAQPATRAP